MIDGFQGRCSNGFLYEVRWHHEWMRVTGRLNGIHGWATIVRSSNPEIEVGSIRRIHQCAHNPCTALWTNNAYYYGPPLHLQPVYEDSESAVAESAVAEEDSGSESAVAEQACAKPAVAEKTSSELAVAESAPDGPAAPPVMEHMGPQAAPSTEEPATGSAVAEPVAEPVAASLPSGSAAPAAPLAPAPVVCGDPPPAVVTADCPLRAEATVLRKMLDLARQIRRPRATVGYSFFILFGLCKRCRPVLWEGENRVDLVQTFAPWALEMCRDECAVEGICCHFEVCAGGQVLMHPVTEEHTLSHCNRFIACAKVEAQDAQGTGIEATYLRRGRAILGTVADGDCGVDTASIMIGLPQTAEDRKLLRMEI